MSFTDQNSHVTVGQTDQIMKAFASKSDARFQKKSDVVGYTVKKQDVADTGYASTYQLFEVGTGAGGADTPIGAKINIAKDQFVESGSVETVTTADVPYQGAVPGDRYVDLVLANATSQHIYIPVNELVDVYTQGNGIVISNNQISIAIDNSNANGLSVGNNGLGLGTAGAASTGALSSTDWNTFNGKQNALTAGVGVNASDFANGTLNIVGDLDPYTGDGTIVTVNNHVINVAAATASTSGVGGNAGTMSAADKEKLDGFSTASAADIQEIIDGIWPAA